MFSSKYGGILLSVVLLALVVIMLFASRGADAGEPKTSACLAGSKICLKQDMSTEAKSLVPGAIVNFKVTLSLPRDMASIGKVSVRYVLPRQLAIMSSRPQPIRQHINNVLVWQVKAGGVRSFNVRAQVLSPRQVTVYNRVEATLLGAWLRHTLYYPLNKQIVPAPPSLPPPLP